MDTAKSAVPIDEGIHSFVKALGYKEHELRKHQRDPDNYTGGKTLPTNTQEPIGWAVEAVNDIYEDVQAAQLKELRNEAYKDIVPKTCTPQQQKRAQEITRTYNGLIDNWRVAKDRLRERRPEDQQPTLAITTLGGKQLIVQNLQDSSGELPIWRAAGVQPDWKIHIRRNEQNKPGQTRFSAHLNFPGQGGKPKTELLGYLSPESIDEHGPAIAAGIREQGQQLTLSSPDARIQAPFAQQNDADEMIFRATEYLQTAIAQIEPESRADFASAFWRDSDGMGIALKQFTDVLCDRLQTIPEIKLTGIQYKENEVGQIPPGEYTVQFSELTYTNRVGETKTSPSITIVEKDGSAKHFGVLDARSLHLPLETTVIADIAIEETGKTAKMRVLKLADPAKIVSPLEIKTDSSTEFRSSNDLPDQYNPSRHELREWHKAAHDNKDMERVAWIVDKGVKLRDLFREASKDSEAIPPLDYCHPDVAISSKDHQEMSRVIPDRALSNKEKQAEQACL